MPTPRKVEMVAGLKDSAERATIAIATDYSGLSVAQLTKLRRAMRPVGAEVKVVKNRLAAMAATEAGRPEMGEITQGPTAITFGYDDAVASAKALTEHFRAERLNVAIYGGWMDGRVLTAAQVEEIATLPPKEQLIANFMAKMQGPLYGFAGLMQATIRNFYGLVESRASQLEA
jgi:large subunit ribosomal protein L10